MSALLYKVTKVFRETLDDDDLQISLDSSPATVEGWDSLVHVKLFLALESQFDVVFSPDELARRLIPLAPAPPTCGGLEPFSPRHRQDVDRAGSNGISLLASIHNVRDIIASLDSRGAGASTA